MSAEELNPVPVDLSVSLQAQRALQKKAMLVGRANRIATILAGENPDVDVYPGTEGRNPFGDTPDAIPHVGYTAEILGKELAAVSGLGYFAVNHLLQNEKPSDVFDTGFYAAVLAVKAGLIDVEAFESLAEDPQQQA